MTFVELLQLVIFAAYAFGHRSLAWVVFWTFGTVLLIAVEKGIKAALQVRAEDKAAQVKRARE